MIPLEPNPTFTIPVGLSVPGRSEQIEIPITFRYLDDSQYRAWAKTAATRPDPDTLHDVIVGWNDAVRDPDGKPVPYSFTALVTLLERYRPAAGEIYEGFQRELRESKKKT